MYNSRNQMNEAKEYITLNLAYWCNAKAVSLQEQYPINTNSGTLVDWCIESMKIAVLYAKHTDIAETVRRAGYRIIYLTSADYQKVITYLNKICATGE